MTLLLSNNFLDFSYRRKIFYTHKKKLKKEINTIIAEVLDEVTDGIMNHTINLVLGADYGAQSYMLEHNIRNFFISKKIQDNVNRTYNVKQSSRYTIAKWYCGLAMMVRSKTLQVITHLMRILKRGK